MKIPQTIEMQVGALNASEHNPRQITEDDFAELVKSLLLLPKGLYYRPVVVDDRNIALAGNMRLRALKYIHELGFDDLAEILRASYRFRHFDEAKQSALLNYWREWQMHPTVPTLYASELDEDEQQQFIIKDNLSFGTFDIDMLANEYDIAAIIDDGFDIDLLPKSAIEALAAANGIDPNDITGRRCGGDGEADEIQRRNTADAQGHELVHLLRRPTVSIHRPYQRRRQYLRPAGVAGGVFLSILQIGLDQLETQSNSGGMTELYLDAGTYVKSFYTVMYCPSCVVVSAMGTAHRRLHHHIKWRYAVPKILHESVKKVTTNGITPKQ